MHHRYGREHWDWLNWVVSNRSTTSAERNRLGGVLLLKGKDNISSSNEVYENKLKTYANTLLWNETLRADTYKSKLDFTAFQKEHELDFHALETFGPDELDYRHRLLFNLSGLIWDQADAPLTSTPEET